ncbi:unnamed protein product [Parascedosporium putredinis]|uniref:Glucoamylase n=1 Tax=Parascedosporium putredinis TaxID=1442378 RepID=A0A9P1GX99_9PEZI|nr:unnamed protein product [Parascedosporium putredinis]CAI7988827.1 unnamed protein product [Parascedosporium putredinis]
MEAMATMYQRVLGLFGTPAFLLFAPTAKFMSHPDAGSMSISTPTSWNGSIDDFIAWERPIALANILCNIGPDCVHDQTVSPGVVLASPSKVDPDYFYTWTRDAALVFKGLVEIFAENPTASTALQTEIHNYILTQAQLQTLENPSGSLRDGAGLAEPKFGADLSPFAENWGRPQRDGPPLRAIALIGYANWLLEQGDVESALERVWPVIQNDLSYVVQYWYSFLSLVVPAFLLVWSTGCENTDKAVSTRNRTGFDLWEEVRGSSFFTTANQYRALVEGSSLAKALGFSCPHCDMVSPQILCFMQDYWSPTQGHVLSNTLSTHKILADAFRHERLLWRPPWYLATLAAAEQMYDALYVWQQDGRMDVTETSLPFFRDFSPALGTGTYLNNSAEFGIIMNAVTHYADGFLQIVADHVHPNGSIAEQFTRDEGTPTSARDLTWSYGALLSAIARRDKQMPREWLPIGTDIPQTCAPISIIGYYASANPSHFPSPAQDLETNLPKANLLPEGSCPPTRYVVVRFDVRARTSWGQKIRMVGDQDILGSWDPRLGVDLDASTYTEKDPVWSVSMVLVAGHTLKYKFVRVSTDGDQVEWENDPDRTYSAPTKCNTADVVSEAWQ